MGDLEERVQRAALEASSSGESLSPKEAARAEREVRRQADLAEAARTESLRNITLRFRAALRARKDVGTVALRRPTPGNKVRGLLQRTPRGWLIARLPSQVLLPGDFHGATRPCELQLALLTDSKLYAGADGVVWERYRFGQVAHPQMPVSFPMPTWRDLESLVPETIGHHVGRYQLDWDLS